MRKQTNLNVSSWLTAMLSLLALCLLPMATRAQEAGTLYSEGTCGANLTWKLTYTGEVDNSYQTPKNKMKLTISGTGEMDDYKYNTMPWADDRINIYYLEMDEGITHIGQYAFRQISVSSFTFPSTVTSMGSNAFYNCNRLTSVNIPATLTSIGLFAFDACQTLNTITVDPGNPAYDSRDNCNALIETATNTLLVAGNSAFVPYGVETIFQHSFYNRTISSITIPNSVKTIDMHAFAGCNFLKSVELPASLERIESDAFAGCNALETITVDEGNPRYDSRSNCNAVIETNSNTLMVGCKNTKIVKGIKAIYSGAFKELSSLTTITLPSTLMNIWSGAFSYCNNVTDVYCYAPPTMEIDPQYNGIFTANTTFHVAPEAYDNWVSMWRSKLNVKFMGDLTEPEPEGGEGTFESEITSTFSGFQSESYEIVTNGLLSSLESKNWRFIHSGSSHRLAYGDMTTYGGQQCLAFGFADNPVVTLLPNFPLQGKLLKVIFKVGGDLKNATVRPNQNGDDRGIGFSSPLSGAIYEFEVAYGEEGVEVDPNNFSIQIEKFSNDVNQPIFIQSITLVMLVEGEGPENGGNCGSKAKWQLTDAGKKVEIYKDGTWQNVPGKKLTISGTGAMKNYEYSAEYGEVAPWADSKEVISEVVVSEGITSIGRFAFTGVGATDATLTIPSTVTSIGSGAFDNTQFADVYCYADVDELTWENARYSLYNRVVVHVPEADLAKWQAKFPDVNFLIYGDLAQPGELPGGKCGNNVRWKLVSLNTTHEIWWSGREPQVYDSRKVVITGTGDMTNYTDWELVPWMRQNRYNIVEMEVANGITSIGDNAMGGALKLTKLSIPGSVRSIGYQAFYNCDLPSSLDIPDGVETIGEQAFDASSNLRSITIPASVTSIGAGALAAYRIETIVVDPANPVYTSRDDAGNECNIALEKATGLLVGATVKSVIPSTVKTIGNRCFENAKIKELTIPNSVVAIGSKAFYYCPELVTMTIGSGVKSIGQDAFQSTSNLLDVFCYANPNTLEWAEKSASYVKEFKNDKMTQFHVYAADLDTWKTKFSFVNVTFVGDLASPIKPVVKEKEIAFDGLSGKDMAQPQVVDDVYYNLGNGGSYQSAGNYVVITQTTDMKSIKSKTPGSQDIRDKYTGLILKVGAGRGKVTVSVATKGHTQLAVQIGDGTPAYAVRDSRGDVMFTYNVPQDTYVYIYSVADGQGVRGAPDDEDALIIYGVTVTPETESVEGDLNGDGNVDVGDIMAIINIMAANSSDLNGDLNGDGNVDVGDIMAIINIMAK